MKSRASGARRIETGAQLLGPGVAAVGNQHLAGHRLAAQQRLRTVPVGQLQVAEAATTQVVHPVQAPIGACAAGLAQAAAIGNAQAAPRPQQRPARRLSCQQSMSDAGQECHRAVQPLVQRLAGEFGQRRSDAPRPRCPAGFCRPGRAPGSTATGSPRRSRRCRDDVGSPGSSAPVRPGPGRREAGSKARTRSPIREMLRCASPLRIVQPLRVAGSIILLPQDAYPDAYEDCVPGTPSKGGAFGIPYLKYWVPSARRLAESRGGASGRGAG